MYFTCEAFQVFVPNIFTPNGDDINDDFKPLSDCEPEYYDLQICNRWGALVFTTNDFMVARNGEFKTQPAPAYVYIRVIKYSLANGQAETPTGDLTLMR